MSVRFRRNFCTYCGERADSLDHVVPFSVSGNFRRSYKKTLVVQCCRQCNSSLGNRGFDENFRYTIASKAKYLLNRYKEKYKDYLDSDKGDFTEAEVKEFTGNLQKIIKEDKLKRDIIVSRIKHLEVIAALEGLEIEEVWKQIEDSESKLEKHSIEMTHRFTGNFYLIDNANSCSVKEIKKAAEALGVGKKDILDILDGLDVDCLHVLRGK